MEGVSGLTLQKAGAECSWQREPPTERPLGGNVLREQYKDQQRGEWWEWVCERPGTEVAGRKATSCKAYPDMLFLSSVLNASPIAGHSLETLK